MFPPVNLEYSLIFVLNLSLQIIFSLWTDTRRTEVGRPGYDDYQDYDYDYDLYLPLERIGQSEDYYYYYVEEDPHSRYPLEDRSGTAVINPLAALIAPLAGGALYSDTEILYS